MAEEAETSTVATEAVADFRRGRDFAAWFGLVPRQRSSGSKQRLGQSSKWDNANIRRLLMSA
jgi:transposase